MYVPLSDDYPTAVELDRLAYELIVMDDDAADAEGLLYIWTAFDRTIRRALAVAEEP